MRRSLAQQRVRRLDRDRLRRGHRSVDERADAPAGCPRRLHGEALDCTRRRPAPRRAPRRGPRRARRRAPRRAGRRRRQPFKSSSERGLSVGSRFVRRESASRVAPSSFGGLTVCKGHSALRSADSLQAEEQSQGALREAGQLTEPSVGTGGFLAQLALDELDRAVASEERREDHVHQHRQQREQLLGAVVPDVGRGGLHHGAGDRSGDRR